MNNLFSDSLNNDTKFSSRNNKKVIAVLLAGFYKPEYSRFISSMEEYAKEKNYKFVFFSTIIDFYYDSYDAEGEKSIFDLVPIEKFDAILIFSESFKDIEVLKSFVRGANIENIPVITVDRKLPGASAHLSFSYGDAFRKICEHMVKDHNYQNIYFMGGTPGESFSEERHEIYKQVLHENNKPYNVNYVYYGYFWETPCIDAMNKMFNDISGGQEMPDCIICANDAMAFTVSNYLMNKRLRVPEDIAVSGLDGMEFEEYFSPRLTTGITDINKFITELFKLIDGNLSSDSVIEDIEIPSFIQIGCSCGCEGKKSLPAGAKIMELRTSLANHLGYEQNCAKLVSNNGIGVLFEEAMKSVPNYMAYLNYDKFWFVCNEDFIQKTKPGANKEFIDYSNNLLFTKDMSVWNFQNLDNKNTAGFNETVGFGDILPNFDKILEGDNTILVLPVYAKGSPIGYIVITFDCNKFHYNEFLTFLNNFHHMLIVQYDQIHLLQIYITDQLTGLYNRTGFNQRVTAAISENAEKEISLISADIRELKTINDSWGHSEGDNAIIEIANILGKNTKNNILARVEGDVFLICLIGDNLKEKSEQIIHDITMDLDKRNLFTDKYYKLDLSMDYFTADITTHTADFFFKKADDLIYNIHNI